MKNFYNAIKDAQYQFLILMKRDGVAKT